MAKNKNISNMKYEDALDELKKVISELELGQLDLEELIKKYEYGKELLDYCQQLLENAELKIQKLNQSGGKEELENGEA